MGIFDECKFYTYDSYWQELFCSCEKNKFPKGLSYSKIKNTLYVRVGPYRETVPLASQSPAEVFTLMMDIFQNKFGLKSPMDRNRSKSYVKEFRNASQSDREWKHSPRHEREVLYTEYARKLAERHQLSSDERSLLYAYIELQILLKNILSSDVVYKNDEIQSIGGLSFNIESRSFTLDSREHQDGDKKTGGGKPAVARESDRFLKMVAVYARE